MREAADEALPEGYGYEFDAETAEAISNANKFFNIVKKSI